MKQSRLTKKQQDELLANWKARNKEFKKLGIAQESYEQYLAWVFGKGEKTKPDFRKKLSIQQTTQKKQQANCVRDWTTGVCAGVPTKTYTGDKMIGVSILHKSCLQPVFNEQAAKDAASMRR